ncbi:MAG: hypothetical protein E7496_04165 [Ruminococcus sp.]|nr:hypothetical protein [Ruminococcus sp.]
MTSLQKDRCEYKIHTTAKTAAGIGAGGSLIPGLHLVKRVPLAALEIKMVIDLAKIFDKDIDESLAQAILSAALATAGGKIVAGAVSDGLAGFIPGIGAIVGGATAAATVEAVGWAVVDLLDSGEF